MAGEDNTIRYNDPHTTASDVGPQIRIDHYYKKALIDIRNKQYFQPLANVKAMPKHMGKTMKLYHYIPVLDDRNINDQGIDAAGAVIVNDGWVVRNPDGSYIGGATEVAATVYADEATAQAAAVAGDLGGLAYEKSGNLYGSSKDIGLITAKLPALTENGGRVNRIGHTRVVVEGSIVKQGFFSEYTQESMDFDTDAELMSHITEESLVAANELTEDNIQKDLLNGAGVVRYAGTATANSEISGDTADISLVTYKDLVQLSIDLDDNKCPKSTKIITGTRMIDTRVVPSARYLYCGSEMILVFEEMEDLHQRPALKPVETYAAAGSIMNGEIGAVGQFRIIVVPEMMKWAGAGASCDTIGNDQGYYSTGDHFDVFPLLVVGSGAFSTIGFQTDGKTVKFKIIHKKPGYETATAADPYGEKGHYAIKWYYGSLILRPEWIALLKTVAPY